MLDPSQAPNDGVQTGRVWSLLDMINFMVPHYMAMLRMVHEELSLAHAKLTGGGDAAIDGADKDRIKALFDGHVHRMSKEHGFERVLDRVERIQKLARPHEVFTLSEIVRQMQALLEAFEDDTKLFYLYAYPKTKVQTFLMA